MKVADLSAEVREKIAKVRFDMILEKHEGPYDWKWAFKCGDLEFNTIDDRSVLLPIDLEYQANITILRTTWSADGNSVTIFLTDSTYEMDASGVGYVAICNKVAGEEFWLVIIYHEWFIIEPDLVFEVTEAIQAQKKRFCDFTYKEAFKHVGISELARWAIVAEPIPISEFFRQRLDRLQRFDLESLEVSKTLLIDAICEEGLEGYDRLKIWKGAYLEGEQALGNAEYLIAECCAYLEAPFVCITDAKRDNFEQGTARCLVEMQACQWINRQLGREMVIYGIVTNGDGWKFYRLELNGKVAESRLYGIGEMSILLGLIRVFFGLCQQNLL